METLREFLNKVKLYIQVTHVSDIARRYFAMNGFDGSMTVLGVILGAWITGVKDPKIIVMTGFGACLAMGVSGFFGAYITEKAERRRQLRELEESMLEDLDDSLHRDASEFVPALTAITNCLSPALTAAISLVPFIFSMFGIIPIFNSYIASFTLTSLTLFSIGIYLGRVAGENVWLYGIQMLMAGLVITIILFLLGGFA